MQADPADRPPYEPARVLAAPFPERVRLVCLTWASQVAPNPFIVLVFYWLKYLLLFAGGWAFFVSFDAGYPGFASTGWAFSDSAFQKAILWALFYESAGFGCSMGPMNGRFNPPIGGLLYFLRPGTTKLPLFPGIPLLGGMRRTWLDVGLWAANMLCLLRALVAPELTAELLLPSVVLLPLLGVTDKTLFLAARGEHYWVALLCLVAASGEGPWIAGCKAVWCAIWFWAAVSKLNHHFPSVVQVMMNAGPFTPRWLGRRLFVAYPTDLRPSRLAAVIARLGTATELALPFALLLASASPLATAVVLCVMAGFHGFIAANNPAGMPIEWNLVMVYGAIFLFGLHPEVGLLALGDAPLLASFLAFCLVAVPLYGNLFPERVSFLLAMRYYAGNWAYNIWLFRKGSTEKLRKLTKAAGTMGEQLAALLPDAESVEMALAMSMSHRFMHLEGRPLLDALPKAVGNMDDYEWVEGEVLGGMVLGWNFGDGHLNATQLLEAVQAQCGFEEGELRVVTVESQPLFGSSMQWKIVDAKSGLVEEGATEIEPTRGLQPWPTGEHAEAFRAASRGPS